MSGIAFLLPGSATVRKVAVRRHQDRWITHAAPFELGFHHVPPGAGEIGNVEHDPVPIVLTNGQHTGIKLGHHLSSLLESFLRIGDASRVIVSRTCMPSLPCFSDRKRPSGKPSGNPPVR
ncbi:hypothetical protein FKO01_20075 [Mesorhizobium sp. B2-3-3]|uniref:hypothetical protein n=1 Tax=Mesorhizobium sp. B2-4-15 TaxID=2589934 RepID=UPI00115214EB|nr:hypothetical protein [Mesorhizobium sp. B2-4-15]TPN29059.1 hypothetical protein FKO01_20075 [Mesorhizobium sp. B2-3-3]